MHLLWTLDNIHVKPVLQYVPYFHFWKHFLGLGPSSVPNLDESLTSQVAARYQYLYRQMRLPRLKNLVRLYWPHESLHFGIYGASQHR